MLKGTDNDRKLIIDLLVHSFERMDVIGSLRKDSVESM